MIAAVYTCRNEADIVEISIKHMLAEGVDMVYVADGMSTDGTTEILHDLADDTGQVAITRDELPYHAQAYWVNKLAALAAGDGYDWIIPSDIDEFWYATSGETIADAVANCEYDKLYVRMWHHYDWNTKEADPKPLPKVAYRWSSEALVAMGNHEVSLSGGTWDVLEIRELQYRNVDHFIRKVRERNATLEPQCGGGWHHSRFANMSDEELRAWWEEGNPFWGAQRNPIVDPIKSRVSIGLGLHGVVQ